MAALLLLIPVAVLGYALGWFVRRTGRRVITIDVEPTVYERFGKYTAKYHHLDLIVYQAARVWRIRIEDTELPDKGWVEERTYVSPEEAIRGATAAAQAYLQEFYKERSYPDVPEAEIDWEVR